MVENLRFWRKNRKTQ